MGKSKFIKGVEKLIDPIEVGSLHFVQYFNNFIPLKIQRKMVDSSAKVTPYMGFVVEPYSSFLCYEIKDLDMARNFLPDGFELVKTKVFEEDEPKYYGIFGCFNAHTSGFWGMRVEFYIIAENKNTGLLSWIIVDYDTNTITYDPKNGLSDPNASGSLMTIDYSGTIYVDVKNNNERKLIFNTDIKDGNMSNLHERLWIEGNLSIAYGRNKCENDPGLFSLTFDPLEFEKAIRIPKSSLNMIENNWFPGLLCDEPSEILCFPYAQHFLSDSPGHSRPINNKDELNEAVKSANFNKLAVFSTKSIKHLIVLGGLVSLLSNIILIILFLLK